LLIYSPRTEEKVRSSIKKVIGRRMMSDLVMNRFHSVGDSERSDFSSLTVDKSQKDQRAFDMTLSTSCRGATAVDYIDCILKESLEKSANIEDIMMSDDAELHDSSFLNVINADDITELLKELDGSNFEVVVDENVSKGISVSPDIFDPIPFEPAIHQIVPDDDDSGESDGSFLYSSNPNVVAQASASHPKNVLPAMINEHRTDANSPGSLYPSSDEEDYLFEDGVERMQNNKEPRHSDNSETSYCPKFRDYQTEQWTIRFDELCQFYEKHGHSSVPHTDKSNKCLARWVKRQRYQYKLRQEGKPSAMTDERIKALERLSFVWDSHGAAWEDRLKELEQYKAVHKHCNVPSNYRANASLASWVKCQRRQWRLYQEGKESNMTKERIDQLLGMGFQFNIRMCGSSNNHCSPSSSSFYCYSGR
jgi:hypothetical protein